MNIVKTGGGGSNPCCSYCVENLVRSGSGGLCQHGICLKNSLCNVVVVVWKGGVSKATYKMFKKVAL